jgi:predicted ATPase/DNA-binding CsgD family transcriptional regulator
MAELYGAAACDYGTSVGQSGAAESAAGRVHGFPAALTSFVGRVGPVTDVAGLLAKHRLVTVTGPGGVGKTRLAGEVARRVAGQFADGVWLVELAAVQDPARVPGIMAGVLGVREQPGVPAVETMIRALAHQQLLLVVDNCEHVVNEAARLCAGLLAACDDVRVLATSREPLRMNGEARYRLGSLTMPDPGDPIDRGGSEAVTLFVDRAQHTDARFVLDEETGPAVVRLVTRLDGMPLAIELAAARVEAIGVAQLLARLDDRFALLSAGDRLSGRHRSLAATVEWSYRLLEYHEQRVFRALSVFPGPFTLAAAEAVAGPDSGLVLLHLVDCSLVGPPQAGLDNRSRYALLETLRAYGMARLDEAGERDGAAAALTGYALEVAAQAAEGLQTSEGELPAARWLDAEDVTMRQALEWAKEHDPEVALRLAAALAPWWDLRSGLPHQHALLRQVSALAVVGSDEWCAIEFWLGMTARFSADMAGALGHFTAVRDAVRDRGPSRALADALTGRASVLREQLRINEATEDADRALAIAREIGYPAGEVLALHNLTQAAMIADDVDRAVQLARQIREAGPATGVPSRAEQARSDTLTSVLMATGDQATAERICAAAIARSRHANNWQHLARLLSSMVLLDLEAGRIRDAAAHQREALQILVRAGSWFELLNAMMSCGCLCVATGRYAEAVTLWAAYDAFCRRTQTADWPADARHRQRYVEQARQVLGAAGIRAAEERGAAMTMVTAAEYALMLTDLDPQVVERGAGPLTARERELVTLVAQGSTDAQIAVELGISIRTVRSHLDRIRDKTGCRRRADLTRFALRAELV